MSNGELRAYLTKQHLDLVAARNKYNDKPVASGTKGDFGIYCWIQGQLTEIDNLVFFLDQQVRKE